MISSIVDQDGILVYAGNIKNPKFAVVLARPGHSRIDSSANIEMAITSKAKWDGSKWVEEPMVSLGLWKRTMQASDTGMPRYLEDHIKDDHDGVAGNEFLQAKFDDKKALRATRP